MSTEKPEKTGKPEKTEKSVKPEKVVKKKRKLTNVSEGIAHIQSTFNNTIISITDMTGNVIASASAGTTGYKGSRKGTPYAAQLAAQKAAEKVMALGMQKIRIYVNGPGPGRESAIRSLQAIGIKIILIRDVTPIPHNGCRPPKRRRV